MNTILHKSETRGHTSFGWLNSYHSFSFGNYSDPERTRFGALRVLNDDTVEAGKGFNTHPHQNMEIISIPLEGELEHSDNMGNVSVIKAGDIQVMSAGTGIHHSEYNKNSDREVKFLQIWLYPDKMDVTPRYQQISLNTSDRHNSLQQVLSPDPDEDGVWIHQKAWFHLGRFDKGVNTGYDFHLNTNGLYVFVLEGQVSVEGQHLSARDGFGIYNISRIKIEAETETEFLLMEVPMDL